MMKKKKVEKVRTFVKGVEQKEEGAVMDSSSQLSEAELEPVRVPVPPEQFREEVEIPFPMTILIKIDHFGNLTVAKV